MNYAEILVKHLGHRGNTVGRAGAVGYDTVACRVVFLLVDAENDGYVFFLGRCRYYHPLCAALQMSRSLTSPREQPCRFDDDVHSVIAPRYPGRVTLGQDCYLLAVHHYAIVSGFYVAGIDAVVCVILEEMGVGPGVGEIIDRGDLQLAASPLDSCLHGQPAYASEAVDSYSCCHFLPPSILVLADILTTRAVPETRLPQPSSN